MLLVWYLGVRPELQWVVAEQYIAGQGSWKTLAPVYVANDATRYEHGGLEGATHYRYQVCAYAKDPNGKASRYCTDQISAPVTRALNVKAVLTIPVQFEIGGLTPARGGFQPCTGITGYIGKIVFNKFESSRWSNSQCAAGNVTITQTARAVNMTAKKIRLIVTEVAFSEGGGISAPQTDVYEMAFPNPNYVTFQVAFASGIGPYPANFSYSEHDMLTNAFSYGPPVKFTVQYEGTNYQSIGCTYKSTPVAVSCP
jgi:hypothetical protein